MLKRILTTALLLAVFALGYVCGTVNQQPADAQIGGLLEKGGGVFGSAKEMGSAIVEMQDHVNGLQKNLDTFKKVQSSITGK
ncbi:MAG TPA: hypothetical protein VL754_01310 [Verrucomicrobiae bacterium]|jgi:hypothetical protein|nr:hypothetical protein [Verrucomicrobiae bacterium]